MIIRTDIPAFYSKWLINRIREGYVLVRNPYYPNQVTKYNLSPEVVDCLAFCTKNNENWYKQSEKYESFLTNNENKNLVLLEIGVGFNTPGIIRFPFEQMTYNNFNTTLIRINKDYSQTMLDINNKTVSFDEDTRQILVEM